ncbi:putative phosphonate catabolism associated alcohol dehydrogenase [Mycolicibacterium rutilum]|uniref:alcohol dehydrogenase n=1 Tax=Mycolicibacterium rutilum TaxID=370526 RepID=A0A1H6J3P0_MYCRU|nr:zinc-binding dehydrogenase [Mycolicibacterium rutilum]SEH53426.1 putative phosphonate catabolism associated alcohol dehydrogenase [Mycolicibacterium rutilum]
MDPLATGVSRAAVWTGTGVEVRDVALPQEADVTLVRVRLATVCGSDLHTVAGRRGGPCPSVLGHEAVGEVVVAGAQRDIRVGDRVVWSVTSTCGACARCRSGRTAKCHAVRKVGHEPFDGDWPLSGGYAEHIALPAGVAVQRIPDTLDDKVAAPAACATATVMATLEAAGALPGQRVLIVGAGMLGVTAAAACTESGAKVAITDIDRARVLLAERFGAVPDSGGPVDVAIDFSGSAPATAAALNRLEVGGILVLAGAVLPGPPLSVDPEAVVRGWWTITGVHNYERHHLELAVDFLQRTRDAYPWASLVSDPVGLDAADSALTAAPLGALRASIAP